MRERKLKTKAPARSNLLRMSRRPIIHSARRLRQTANAPEDIAWQALRELRKYGYAVRRQHPIGPYVVDFAIQKAMLAIEIDGGIHNLDTVQLRDELRQADLELRGWQVLRLSAEQAMDADTIMRIVTETLGL